MSTGLTGRLARISARRPWLTITVWTLVIAAAVVSAGSLSSVVTHDERMLIPTDSEHAADLYDTVVADQVGSDSGLAHEILVVQSPGLTISDATFDQVLADLASDARDLPGVVEVTVPTEANSPSVSADGTVALVHVTVDPLAHEDVGFDLVDLAHQASVDGFQVTEFGETTAEAVFDTLAEDTLIRGELIGISVAIVILAVVFGALAAAGIPLGVALVSIITAVGATAIVGRVFELSFFVLNMVMMMGLALGIDYSLVTVQRFREELAKGRSVADAVVITGATANRAIVLSGITVVIALTGMLVIPSSVMRSLGMGAIIVAVTSVIAALTLLPAVLGLLGPRINKGRIPTAHPGAEPRRWTALARTITNRPAVWTIAGVSLLVVLAVPFLSLRLAFPGLDSLPEDNSFRVSAEVLVNEFEMGQSQTIVALEGASSDPALVDSLAERIDGLDAFADTSVMVSGDVAVIETNDVYDAADPRAEDAIADLRDTVLPAALAGSAMTATVGGEQASSMDFTREIENRAPLSLIIILGASLILLTVAFRSVVIAASSVVLNLLSAGATFGILVAVFQYGWGADLLGFAQVSAIAPWIPLFLFAVLFGLSMDYHVFLLSRVKEHRDAHGNTRDAVVFGLGRTGALITGAALIMVAVFSGFALGDLAEFQQMGFGLAVAIILDATIVRGLLAPALLSWLGERSWYLPHWLQWLPQVQLETDDAGDVDSELAGLVEDEPALVPAVRV